MGIEQSAEEHVVVCRLGNEHYALEISAVEEIIRMQPITKVPEARGTVEGVTNFRSYVMPVLDTRLCCGFTPGEESGETRIVVVVDKGERYGLIMDAVSEVVRIPLSDIEPVASILGSSRLIRGIAKLDGRLVSLLDLQGILAEPAAESEGADALAA